MENIVFPEDVKAVLLRIGNDKVIHALVFEVKKVFSGSVVLDLPDLVEFVASF